MDNQPNRIEHRDISPRMLMRLIDSASVVLGLFVLITWVPEVNSRSTIVVGLVAIGVFGLIADFLGLYRSWRGIAFEREATCTILAWLGTFGVLAALGNFSLYTTELNGSALIFWFLVSPIISLSGRVVYRMTVRWMIRRGIRTRNYAIVGVNQLGIQLVRNIQSSPELGLRFVGFYDDRDADRTEQLPEDMGRLGELKDLLESARRGEVQVVYITVPMRAEERIREMIRELSDTTASVYIVPDLFVFQLLHSRWTEIKGLPVVSVFENPFYGIDGMLKRTVDVVLASTALVALAVPMCLIAIAIKLTSRGPVFFRQRRYGLDGRCIRVWKFRSMTVTENGDSVTQARQNDPRVTRVGAFLRRTSLDELPQLFNVLIGNMSIVGPRPHANAHNEFYRKEIEGYMLRHKVKPGITGLAQVHGCRGETDTVDKMERRVRFDLQYIREWSIWMDLKIIFRTFAVVLRQENAY